MGEIDGPSYDQLNHDNATDEILIGLLWLVWILNQVFVFIILLNFIIAVISQSFERVMNKSSYIKYHHKALLNREVRLYRSYIPHFMKWFSYKKIELMIFTVRRKYEEDTDEACWTNSTYRTKKLIR